MGSPQSRRPKLLLVSENWVDCNPGSGLSAFHHNFLGSLHAADIAEFEAFFIDEALIRSANGYDEQFVSVCDNIRPDLIFLKMVRGVEEVNPSVPLLQLVRDQFGIPILSVYGDSYDDDAMRWIERYNPVVDLNIVQDCYSAYRRYFTDHDKFLDVWTPQDPQFFFAGNEVREIPVSFVGSIARYPDRKLALGALQMAGIAVQQGGGEAENPLTVEDYAGTLRRTKIALNFSRPVFDQPTPQCKGRTMEATLCGALLMEQANEETTRWLDPGVDYVEFSDERDLIEKTRFFLTHETERQEIADAGCAKARARYSASAYWRLVLQRAGVYHPT